MAKKYLSGDLEDELDYMSCYITVRLRDRIIRAIETKIRKSTDPVDDALTLTMDPQIEIN